MKEEEEVCRASIQRMDFRKFLEYFKTKPCPIQCGKPEYCPFFHIFSFQEGSEGEIKSELGVFSLSISYDRRRNPYDNLNRIIYNPKYCDNISMGCQNEECGCCHNQWEFDYHPIFFKTTACERFYESCYEFCSKTHLSDYTVGPKNQGLVIRFSEFFRFDIMTFKARKCQKEYPHDKNLCIDFHNSKDYRRPNFESYDHIECQKIIDNGSCSDLICASSHNKIEQLYHPTRYKSKFCEKHENSRKNAVDPNNELSFKSLCPYGKFCSFAHNDSEVSFELIHKMEKNLEFHLYAYKTVWCPITTEHNRSVCVYAHNIQDYRRNPKNYYYEPVECPFWKKNENIKNIKDAGCPDGMSCNKCHGWKEKEFHPVIYCKNKVNEQTVKSKEKSDGSDVGKGKVESVYTDEKKKMEIINRKLGANFSHKTNLESIVQKEFNKNCSKNNMYTPGVPFFQDNAKPRQIKSKSEKGEVKGDQGEILSQVEERGGSVMTTKSIEMKNKNNYVHFAFDSEDLDDNLFKVFESGNELTCDEKGSHPNMTEKNDSEHGKDSKIVHKATRTVSRSLGCSSREGNNYSKDFIDLLNPNIISVLRDKNISEIKLINMDEEEVRKIDDLTNSQKSLIIKKIINAREGHSKSPAYEKILVKYFIKHKKLCTLAKFKTKNVKQEKLLHLGSELQNLSFLSESEKIVLPKIITEFHLNKEFEQLNDDISKVIENEGLEQLG